MHCCCSLTGNDATTVLQPAASLPAAVRPAPLRPPAGIHCTDRTQQVQRANACSRRSPRPLWRCLWQPGSADAEHGAQDFGIRNVFFLDRKPVALQNRQSVRMPHSGIIICLFDFFKAVHSGYRILYSYYLSKPSCPEFLSPGRASTSSLSAVGALPCNGITCRLQCVGQAARRFSLGGGQTQPTSQTQETRTTTTDGAGASAESF